MFRARLITPLRAAVVVVCALIGVGLLGGESANAGSCGDYLHTSAGRELHQAPSYEATGELGPLSQRDVCQGPQCHHAPRRSNAPAPEAPHVTQLRHEAATCESTIDEMPERTWQSLTQELESPKKLIRARPDRPPR